MRNLQRQMENKLEHEMDSLHDQIVYGIQDVSNNMEWYFEKANRVFAECSLQPSGVDKESRSLLVEVSLTLKEWHEDTEVVLSSKTGAEEETWQQFLPTVSEGDGRYSGQIPLPLDSDGVLFFTLLLLLYRTSVNGARLSCCSRCERVAVIGVAWDILMA